VKNQIYLSFSKAQPNLSKNLRKGNNFTCIIYNLVIKKTKKSAK